MQIKTIIPIYGAILYLIIDEDIFSIRKDMSDIFGEINSNDFDALCSYDNKGTFALFFEPSALNHKTIAHEVFHLTHRITEWRYGTFKEHFHEVFADLCGFLTEIVYANVDNYKSNPNGIIKSI